MIDELNALYKEMNAIGERLNNALLNAKTEEENYKIRAIYDNVIEFYEYEKDKIYKSGK